MAHYKATNRETSEVVEYDADVPQPEHLSPPWVCERVEVIEASIDAGNSPSLTIYGGRRTISKLDFLRLFNPKERITIRLAATQSPEIQDYLYMLELAEEIHLDDVETQTGVKSLEAAGVLATGRSAEILNG